MSEKMKFINNEEIPSIVECLFSVSLTHYLREQKNKKVTVNNSKFKYFWDLTENPIPFIYESFNNKGVFLITHDKEKVVKIKMGDKMIFVETSTIPAKKTKKGEAWLEIFNTIPIGKSWIPDKNKYKVQSVRSARADLEKKGLLKFDIEVTQRTEKDEVIIYVSNKGAKKTK